MEWHPIRTVPETHPGQADHEVLLAWDDGCVRIGVYIGHGQYRIGYDCGDACSSYYCPQDYRPTHWARITPPKS